MTHPRNAWRLDSDITFLNHGSFGACPAAVLAVQERYREQLEAEPVRFFMREAPELLRAARQALGDFIGADGEDLAFVNNATTGVNAVLRSMELAPDDEIVITDHGYNACNNAVRFVCDRAGAKTVTARIPFPIASPQEVIDAVIRATGPRTRLVLIDHITSPTALVLPIDRIVAELARRGIETLVDGAHAPGMVDLDLEALGAAYYTGNCHKWLCAPKGAAFLHVRRDLQPTVRPTVISHGANASTENESRFRLEFDWTGTDDPTPWLAIPAVIETIGALLPGGWNAVRQANRALALEGREILTRALAIESPCPESMMGSMASLVLPWKAAASPGSPMLADPLQTALFDEHRIEVPIFAWPSAEDRIVRVSAQLYNEASDYERLARALAQSMD